MRKMFIVGTMLLVLILAIEAGSTGIGENDSEIRTLLQPLDTEARAYLETRLLSSQDLDLDVFAVYLVEKYNRDLSLVIDELENVIGESFPSEDREDFKLLVVREHLHRIFQESIPDPENAIVLEMEPVLVDTYSDGTLTYRVFCTPMTDNRYPITHWVQVYDDVNGGVGEDDHGDWYFVEGHNDLYMIRMACTTTEVKYTLFFRDEDHPVSFWDEFYDRIRWLTYGRIEDIESFRVIRTIDCRDFIIFEDIWDEGNTYGHWWGVHGSITRPYAPGATVYVSNVWNHAMDIYDTNLTLRKIDAAPDDDIDCDGLLNSEETSGWFVIVRDCKGFFIEEYHVASDPNKTDTDGDGLTDWEEREGWKVRYRTPVDDLPFLIDPYEYHVSSDPRNADADSDGLKDSLERAVGTDPNRSDTDCDGAWDTSDGFEVKSGMNPTEFDTDDDGLTDGEEIDLWIGACGYSPDDPESVPQEVIDIAVSNAKNPDVDGDGMTDGEEIAYWKTLGLAPEEAIVFVGDLDMNQNGILDSLEHFPNVIRRRGLHKGTENSLVSKAENAIMSIGKGNCNVAINQLQAFINEVKAQRGKKISEELAEMLIQYTQNVIWQVEDWKSR
ncbi:MAG: hypothetical protein HXS41_12650 [Theionarchaea archaeon]|nr:hypothetical protein [Theionarchaea archaeon]